MPENPSDPPAPESSQADEAGDRKDFPLVADMLIKTRPWVRMFGAMFLLASIIMVLVAVVFGWSGYLLFFVLYLFGALFYAIPGYFLWCYANLINLFLRGRTEVLLAEALGEQKSFWKFVGIMTLLSIGIYLAILVNLALS